MQPDLDLCNVFLAQDTSEDHFDWIVSDNSASSASEDVDSAEVYITAADDNVDYLIPGWYFMY